MLRSSLCWSSIEFACGFDSQRPRLGVFAAVHCQGEGIGFPGDNIPNPERGQSRARDIFDLVFCLRVIFVVDSLDVVLVTDRLRFRGTVSTRQLLPRKAPREFYRLTLSRWFRRSLYGFSLVSRLNSYKAGQSDELTFFGDGTRKRRHRRHARHGVCRLVDGSRDGRNPLDGGRVGSGGLRRR